MSNGYYEYGNTFIPGDTARAEDVESEFQGVRAGFDLLPAPRNDGTGFAETFNIELGTAPEHPARMSQIQDLIDGVDAIETAELNVTNALQEVQTLNAATMAATNFKGEWGDLTGALNMPATVSHNGSAWLLTADLADVTTSEPGVSGDWQAAYYPAITGNAGKPLRVSDTGDGVVWGSAANYQEFTSSGTWTKPPGVTFVLVEMVNGGSGGTYFSGNNYSQGGGAGGACVQQLLKASDLPASCAVVVGAGGTGGRLVHGVSSAAATSGGQSSFNGVTCPLAVDAAASFKYIQGVVSNNQAGSCVIGGGCGGSVYQPSSGSVTTSVGTSVYHGDGGAALYSSSTISTEVFADDGEFPGGGGGACSARTSTGGILNGGDGADGVVRIWAW